MRILAKFTLLSLRRSYRRIWARPRHEGPQRWAKIEALYHAALARQPAERYSYLEEVCAEEPELRHEIESLLACADAELKGPIAHHDQWPTGFRLGSYEIVAPHGAGGMGEVYRARDARLRREVAINSVAPIAC